MSVSPAVRLRILHLSDLRCAARGEVDDAQFLPVRGRGWETLLSDILAEGPIDLVAFTGDAARSGQAAELDEAKAFIDALRGRLGLPEWRFFPVPGNHDVDRTRAADAWKQLSRNADSPGRLRDELGAFMAGERGALFGLDSSLREQLLSRTAAYQRWLEDIGAARLHPSKSAHGSLGYSVALQDRLWPFPVLVVGLDSAWLSGLAAEQGRLLVTKQQVDRLFSKHDEPGRPFDGPRLVLIHHPPQELGDGEELLKELHKRVAHLLLTGSRSEGQDSGPARSSGEPLTSEWPATIEGGRLFYDRRIVDSPLPRCHVIELEVTRNGEAWIARRSTYVWSPETASWADKAPPTPAAEVSRTGTFQPWNPTSGFVGRAHLLAECERLIDDRGFLLSGSPRVGKTAFLLALAHKSNSAGRRWAWISGRGESGNGTRAFAEALGLLADWEAQPSLWLDSVYRWAEGDSPATLFIDDADRFAATANASLLQTLDALTQKGALRLALTTSMRWRDAVPPGQAFGRSLPERAIGILDPGEADPLVEQGRRFSAHEKHLMREECGRHPFYLQLLGYCLTGATERRETWDIIGDRFRTLAASCIRESVRRLPAEERAGLFASLAGTPRPYPPELLRGLLDEAGRPFGKVLQDWFYREGRSWMATLGDGIAQKAEPKSYADDILRSQPQAPRAATPFSGSAPSYAQQEPLGRPAPAPPAQQAAPQAQGPVHFHIGTVQGTVIGAMTGNVGVAHGQVGPNTPFQAQADASSYAQVLSAQEPQAEPLLNSSEVQSVFSALIGAGLSRASVTAGLDPRIVMGLPRGRSPAEELLSALQSLARTGELVDGSAPLATLLENATLLAGPRRESAVLRDMLGRVRQRLASARTTSAGVDDRAPRASRSAESPQAQSAPQRARPKARRDASSPVACLLVHAIEDDAMANDLFKHVAPIRRAGILDWWDIHHTPPGVNPSAELASQIEDAEIVVVLLSASFLVEMDTFERVLKTMFERRSRGGLTVIPVVVRPVILSSTPFEGVVTLPRNGKAIAQHADRDAAWTEVATTLRDLAGRILKARKGSPP